MSPMKVIFPCLITRMYYTHELEINIVEISYFTEAILYLFKLVLIKLFSVA